MKWEPLLQACCRERYLGTMRKEFKTVMSRPCLGKILVEADRTPTVWWIRTILRFPRSGSYLCLTLSPTTLIIAKRKTGRDEQESGEGGTKKHGAVGFRLDSDGDRVHSRVFKQGSNTAQFKDASGRRALNAKQENWKGSWAQRKQGEHRRDAKQQRVDGAAWRVWKKELVNGSGVMAMRP